MAYDDEFEQFAPIIEKVREQVPGATDEQILAQLKTISPNLVQPAAPALTPAPVAPAAPAPVVPPVDKVSGLFDAYNKEFTPDASKRAEEAYQDKVREASRKSNWSYALGADPSVVASLEANNLRTAKEETTGAFDRRRSQAADELGMAMKSEEWKVRAEKLAEERDSLRQSKDPNSVRSQLAQKVLASAMSRSPIIRQQFEGVDISKMSDDDITKRLPMLEKIIEDQAKEADRKLQRDIQEANLRRQESRDAEAQRHNRRIEDLTLQQRDIAARAADPFGLFGDPRSNPGGGSGASGASAAGVGTRVPVVPGSPATSNVAPTSLRDAFQNNLTGDEFLKALEQQSPSVAAQVKAIAEGRQKLPSGIANPAGRQLQMLVNQYDPSFDMNDFTKRQKTVQGFTTGKQGDAVRAVNQTIKHMGSLADSIEQLNNLNGLGTPLNKPINSVEKFFGDKRQGVFEQTAQAVASELRKVFAGSGGGSLRELEDWKNSLPRDASQEQQRAYLQRGIELLHGGIQALTDQRDAGLGRLKDKYPIISPEAQKVLDKLESGLGGGSSDGEWKVVR